MSSQDLAEKVVQKMLDRDRFSAWLGLKVEELSRGRAVVSMTVREEMLNGFDMLHGGVTFSLADSALGFASNTHGRVALSIENSIAYPHAVRGGERLLAVAEELSVSNRLGVYDVKITAGDGRVVGIFRGTVYRTEKEHFPQN